MTGTTKTGTQKLEQDCCVVLKFGSSLLKDVFATRLAVNEIYRHVSVGKKAIVVISALAGETDRLTDISKQFQSLSDGHLAGFLATGEQQASYLLGMAADDVGLNSVILSPKDLALTLTGSHLDAEPKSLNFDRLQKALIDHDVVIVPGFYGIRENGKMGLLGRGGSDLSALYIASVLKNHQCLSHCTLVKDVEGVFNKDPNTHWDQGDLEIYQSLDYQTAASIAGVLVQPKSVTYAEKHGIGFNVARVGRDQGTYIGENAVVTKKPYMRGKAKKVLLAGLGVVGYGVYQFLQRSPDFEIVKVLVSNPKKHQDKAVPQSLLTSDVNVFNNHDADILIEALSVTDVALKAIEAALKSNIAVISANKQAIYQNFKYLTTLSREHGGGLRYSAAIGGGVPIIERCLAEQKAVSHVEAILNGTCNFVYSRIDEGIDAETAIKEAQEAGFAEADPSADIDGYDALAKIALIAATCGGIDIEVVDIDRKDFEAPSTLDGQYVRQVAVFDGSPGAGQGVLSVKPTILDDHSILGKTTGAQNVAKVTFTDGSELFLKGLGAGRWPTTQSVLSDLYQWYNGLDARNAAEKHIKIAS